MKVEIWENKEAEGGTDWYIQLRVLLARTPRNDTVGKHTH